MINKRIVFILGAGASAPYGFPTGLELIEKIYAIGGQRYGGLLKGEMGFKEKEITDFLKALQYSGVRSIDAFLDNRKEYWKIGKAAIAAALIPFENHSRLFFQEKPDKNWYRSLFEQMRTGADFAAFKNNRVAFITYNYDRSLEHYLVTALENSYGKAFQECAEIIRTIPIIHLHGQLGLLHWQRTDPRDLHREYTNELNQPALVAVLKSIALIHEQEAWGPQYPKAYRLLQTAEKVYVLGFGYHPENLERLDLDRRCSCEIVGSAHNITEKECKPILQQCGKLQLKREHSEALEFCRHYVEWE